MNNEDSNNLKSLLQIFSLVFSFCLVLFIRKTGKISKEFIKECYNLAYKLLLSKRPFAQEVEHKV